MKLFAIIFSWWIFLFALTTFEKRRNVSKSSRIFDVFVVINTIYSFSIGWYTYRTESDSTNVCCLPDVINLGNAANNPSIRARVISMNCLESMTKTISKRNFISLNPIFPTMQTFSPFPALVNTAAAIKTYCWKLNVWISVSLRWWKYELEFL